VRRKPSTITTPLGDITAAAFALSPALKAARNIFAASTGFDCALLCTEVPNTTPTSTNPLHKHLLQRTRSHKLNK